MALLPEDDAANLGLDINRHNRGKSGRAIPKKGTIPRPGVTELEALPVVERLGSFQPPALDLGLSTRALSLAIGKLERQLGVRLFNRLTRSVWRVTPRRSGMAPPRHGH
jgi:hypothetical protein